MTDEENEAIEKLFHLEHINGYLDLTKYEVKIPTRKLIEWQENTKTILNLLSKKDKEIEELKKESVSKKQIRNVLRKVQDYNLNFKDLALFNIINTELLGDNLWKDRIEEE